MNLLRSLYLTNRFFIGLLILVGLFTLSFFFKPLEIVSFALLMGFIVWTIIDMIRLYRIKQGVFAQRIVPKKLSNGDDNPIDILITNRYNFPIEAILIDEIPFVFQYRHFQLHLPLSPLQQIHKTYTLRPTLRGDYHFGHLNVFVQHPWGMVKRRYQFDNQTRVVVYPSIIQMNRHQQLLLNPKQHTSGERNIRKVGLAQEFEHIQEYVQGNDIRHINWKASSKLNKLMVNHYQDQRLQSVYIAIDKGRNMQMPFKELSLLDYAINTTLALSNIIIKKQDKVGLFTFSKTTEDWLMPNASMLHLQQILEKLYNIQTNFMESDFGQLQSNIAHHIKQRSFIILFTNFQSITSIDRQLPYLKNIAQNHLLMVIFFSDTELEHLMLKKAQSPLDACNKIIAEEFHLEKQLIVKKLSQWGILCLMSPPEQLSIQSINSYLNIKNKGLY